MKASDGPGPHTSNAPVSRRQRHRRGPSPWRVVVVLTVALASCSPSGDDDAVEATGESMDHSQHDHSGEDDTTAVLVIPDPSGTSVIGDGVTSNVSISAAGDLVAAAWYRFDEASGVEQTLVATSTDGGVTFGAPVVAAEPATEHPQVQVLDDGTILLGMLTYDATRTLDPQDRTSWPGWPALYRSTDGGDTFDLVADLHDVVGDRVLTVGLPIGMAASDDGDTVVFAWNDRTPAALVASGEPAPVEGTNRQPVWAAVSQDGGTTFGPSQIVSDSTCNCCRADAFVAGDRAGVAYRAIESVAGNESSDERNIGVALVDAQGTMLSGVPVHDDDFILPLAGCPDSGPGVAAGTDGTIHVAWWTQLDETPTWLYATSADGAAFSEPVVLPAEPAPAGSLELAVSPSGGAWVLGSRFEEGFTELRLWQAAPGVAPAEVPAGHVQFTFATESYDIAATDGYAILSWIYEGQVKVLRVAQ